MNVYNVFSVNLLKESEIILFFSFKYSLKSSLNLDGKLIWDIKYLVFPFLFFYVLGTSISSTKGAEFKNVKTLNFYSYNFLLIFLCNA